VIELKSDELTFSFPGVHPDARLVLGFQRTLRIPGGETEMPRLPSLGKYPLYTVESFAHRVPRHWLDKGGAMLPMYQSEAMWLSFRPSFSVAHQAFYPFAVKIRVGGLDAIRGQRWLEGVHQWPQDFLVIKDHCWLGGYHDGGQSIQQFVAMPLGAGYLPENRDNAPTRLGCLEVIVYPMQGSAFAMRYPRNSLSERLSGFPMGMESRLAGDRVQGTEKDALQRQQVEEGLFPMADWDRDTSGRYAVHLANSLHWCAITGSPPPMAPVRERHIDTQTTLAAAMMPEPAVAASLLPGKTG